MKSGSWTMGSRPAPADAGDGIELMLQPNETGCPTARHPAARRGQRDRLFEVTPAWAEPRLPQRGDLQALRSTTAT
ncbi:MAG: hypothetical protein R3F43_08345 [bacterium]